MKRILSRSIIFCSFLAISNSSVLSKMSFSIFGKKEEGVSMKIGISEKNLTELGKLLNRLLSDEYLLYTKTLKCHWNVVGMHFRDTHAFFKDLYEKLFEITDDVAERARALGANAFGTMAEFVKHSSLKENPGVYPDAKGMIKSLLDDHEAIIRNIREDIETTLKLGDIGTNNFLSEIIVKHEKMAWMLRVNLAK